MLKSCSFTGHRPEKFSFKNNEMSREFLNLKSVLEEEIELMYKKGITRYIIGCSRGIDIWVGEIIISMMELYSNVELICVIPFEGQALKWSQRDQKRYNNVLSCCTKKVVISQEYNRGCYMKRNIYMVDNSDVLIGVCDLENRQKSGTYQTLQYAMKKDKVIIHIDPYRLRSKVLKNVEKLIF